MRVSINRDVVMSVDKTLMIRWVWRFLSVVYLPKPIAPAYL